VQQFVQQVKEQQAATGISAKAKVILQTQQWSYGIERSRGSQEGTG
jgi:hypothetical protein